MTHQINKVPIACQDIRRKVGNNGDMGTCVDYAHRQAAPSVCAGSRDVKYCNTDSHTGDYCAGQIPSYPQTADNYTVTCWGCVMICEGVDFQDWEVEFVLNCLWTSSNTDHHDISSQLQANTSHTYIHPSGNKCWYQHWNNSVCHNFVILNNALL